MFLSKLNGFFFQFSSVLTNMEIPKYVNVNHSLSPLSLSHTHARTVTDTDADTHRDMIP